MASTSAPSPSDDAELKFRVGRWLVDATSDIASVEVRPSLEGKRMFMILGPKAGVVKRAKAASPPVAAGAGPAHAAPPGQGAQAPNPPPEQVE